MAKTVKGKKQAQNKAKKPSAARKKARKSSIADKIMSAFSGKKKPQSISAPQTIAYKSIRSDGICRVDNNRYSKTIQFYDINYQLAQNDDKNAIFEKYCDFLNYFDHSISVQLSFINQKVSADDFKAMVDISDQHDEFNDIRREYSSMLKEQLSKGNNGLSKSKYVTFTIEAGDYKTAKQRLERIESDVLNNFKAMGVKAEPLSGTDRLRVLFEIMRSSSRDKFSFSWDQLKKTGMSTKDFIAPSSFDFSKKSIFGMGNKFGKVSYLQILAPELTDRMLTDFL